LLMFESYCMLPLQTLLCSRLVTSRLTNMLKADEAMS